ncbi:MAG: protein kinase, partial [Planctomycetes bacterium]|nr:protein kinase [Planctomycetota bacterium]
MAEAATINITLLDQIGYGANGVVWRATDELERDLAVKFLHRGLGVPRDEIQAHADALVRINHPNVVRIYGIVDCIRPDADGDSP